MAAALTTIAAYQGCEDLEEVLSERLQQLPAPLERAPSAGSQPEPPVLIPDDLPAERERVRLRSSPCLCCLLLYLCLFMLSLSPSVLTPVPATCFIGHARAGNWVAE